MPEKGEGWSKGEDGRIGQDWNIRKDGTIGADGGIEEDGIIRKDGNIGEDVSIGAYEKYSRGLEVSERMRSIGDDGKYWRGLE